MEMLNTPVLFLIFNRPDKTRQVFEAIKRARPRKLFIAADGPRSSRPNEAQVCDEARRIATSVDWPCEVNTLFRNGNLGCGKAVFSAINWFFEHVDEGIILEDDTLPSREFFSFCSELLEYYRHDPRVMEIGGTCLPFPKKDSYPYSYFFSNWDYIWGWATWKRAWQHYDYQMKGYIEAVESGFLNGNYHSLYESQYMQVTYDKSYFDNEKVTWWSCQWNFARKMNSGMVVVPRNNLVINLGIGEGATNTTDVNGSGSKLCFEGLTFPLKHPPFVMINRSIDDAIFKRHFTSPVTRVKSHVKNLFPIVVDIKKALST